MGWLSGREEAVGCKCKRAGEETPDRGPAGEGRRADLGGAVGQARLATSWRARACALLRVAVQVPPLVLSRCVVSGAQPGADSSSKSACDPEVTARAPGASGCPAVGQRHALRGPACAGRLSLGFPPPAAMFNQLMHSESHEEDVPMGMALAAPLADAVGRKVADAVQYMEVRAPAWMWYGACLARAGPPGARRGCLCVVMRRWRGASVSALRGASKRAKGARRGGDWAAARRGSEPWALCACGLCAGVPGCGGAAVRDARRSQGAAAGGEAGLARGGGRRGAESAGRPAATA